MTIMMMMMMMKAHVCKTLIWSHSLSSNLRPEIGLVLLCKVCMFYKVVSTLLFALVVIVIMYR